MSINIKEKFLQLTSRTYPHGAEEHLYHILPKSLLTDEFGNKYIQIGETTTMFTSHLDTADKQSVQVKHVIDGDFIKTDETSILGADDKAGVTIMLYMIENKVPGLYYFFLGEEVGCIGSRALSDKFKKPIDEDDEDNKTTQKIPYITKVIAFDRRDVFSVITHQSSSRCCSDTFGNALAEAINIASDKVLDNDTKLNFKIDTTGLYTDSANFTSIYPECTNLSVGYYSEHHLDEKQNIKFLDKLAKACCFINWEELPIERDYTKKEYLSYGRDDWEGGWGGWDSYNGYSYSPVRNVIKEESHYFLDRAFGVVYSSTVKVEKDTNKIKMVDFSTERLSYERDIITELFFHLDVVYKTLNWTGEKVIVVYDDTHAFTEITRDELSNYLPDLNFWQKESQKQKEEDFWDCPAWI